MDGKNRETPRRRGRRRRPRDRNRRAETIRILVRPVPRALPAHTEPGDNDLLLIDGVALLHCRQQRVDGLLVRGRTPSTANRIRRDDERAELGERGLDEDLERRVAGSFGIAAEVQREDERHGRAVIAARHRDRVMDLRSVPQRQHLVVNADRKSTRLNSSHMSISYAVFCLKKKKKANSLDLKKIKLKNKNLKR